MVSWNNVLPAWVLTGDSIINQYHEGRIPLEVAEKKLDDLGVPPSMKQRLYKEPKSD